MKLKPIKPDRIAPKPGRDMARDGYSITDLERLIRDCEDQPVWRPRSDKAVGYYDGKQLSAKQVQDREEQSISTKPINLVARVINGVLGTQAKNRRDQRVEADEDEFQDVAEAVSVRFKEAIRETKAHMAVSNGYGSGVKAGIGWVEVSRNRDPLHYPYRVQDVHRNEIWWDWRCKHLDISLHARWLVRRQWHDADELMAEMPEHKDVLQRMIGNWTGPIDDDWLDESYQASPILNGAYENDRTFSVARSEWIDGGRGRIKLYEVWYRVPAEGVFMRVGKRWRAVDENNPLHMEAIQRGVVKFERRVTTQVRRAIFAGPYRLIDEGTKRKRFPYIPFVAFRDDEDGTPYGLIEGMLAPQDGYNDRRQRIDWMLKAQQLLVDNDALDNKFNTIDDIAATMMRPDMVAVLNANRRNAKGLEFRNDLALQKEQWQSMMDDKQLIQDVPGVYSTQLGNAPAGVTAGNAIASLVEQGEVAMGELNDNMSFAEQIVYESLLDLIVDDMTEPNTEVTVGTGSGKRVIMLNTQDEQGRPMNMVADAPIRCGISEVPTSPAYRMQQQQQLKDIIMAVGGASPQAAALLTPIYIETSNHPDRQRIADDLRRMSGIPTAGDKNAQQQQQQAAAKQQAEQAQIQKDQVQADIRHKQAQAELAETRADEIRVRNALAPMETGHRMAMDTAPQIDPEEQAINDAMQEAMAA